MFEIETEKLSVLPVRLETSASAIVYQSATVVQIGGDDSVQLARVMQSALALAIDA